MTTYNDSKRRVSAHVDLHGALAAQAAHGEPGAARALAILCGYDPGPSTSKPTVGRQASQPTQPAVVPSNLQASIDAFAAANPEMAAKFGFANPAQYVARFENGKFYFPSPGSIR